MKFFGKTFTLPEIPFLDTAPRDKLAHALGGVVMFAGLRIALRWVLSDTAADWVALGIVVIIGLAKEYLYDKNTPGRAVELNDALATIGGGVLGFLSGI